MENKQPTTPEPRLPRSSVLIFLHVPFFSLSIMKNCPFFHENLHTLYNPHSYHSPKGQKPRGAFAELHCTREFIPNAEEGLEIISILLRFVNYKWESEIRLIDRGEEQVKSRRSWKGVNRQVKYGVLPLESVKTAARFT